MFKKVMCLFLATVCLVSIAAISPIYAQETYTEYAINEDGEEVELDLQSNEVSFVEVQGCKAEERRSSQVKAPSISVGYEKLLTEFRVRKASNNKKYAYYSPVIDEQDTTKYPVVIYIHGLFHGWTDSSFIKSGLTYWCSSEMQDKFKEGGAHLIAPKIPETTITATQKKNVMQIIQDYVAENYDNIDTSQIYIMGGSAGGGLAWNILIDNPTYFNKALLLCAVGTVSAKEAKKIANVPVWEVSANTDPLVNISLQKTTWNNVCKYSNVKDECRWTRFTGKVTLPDGSNAGVSHFLAKTIGYNFCTISDRQIFPGMSTVDANGKSVNLSWENSIVEWFQA